MFSFFPRFSLLFERFPRLTAPQAGFETKWGNLYSAIHHQNINGFLTTGVTVNLTIQSGPNVSGCTTYFCT